MVEKKSLEASMEFLYFVNDIYRNVAVGRMSWERGQALSITGGAPRPKRWHTAFMPRFHQFSEIFRGAEAS